MKLFSQPAQRQSVVTELLARSGSRLGFGCGNIYGGKVTSQSVRLLETAVDAGLTWFDTARLYGHGEAEGILGKVVRGRRDRFVIASKAGILPTPNTIGRRMATRAAHVARAMPPLRGIVAPPAIPQPRFGVYAPDEVRRSVETSLRNLRTDYLDVLLLHECTPEHVADDGLLALLEDLVGEGKIRAWGVAPRPEDTLALARALPKGASFVQFAHSPWLPVFDKVASSTSVPAILHSVLSGNVAMFTAAVRADPDVNARARELGLDPADDEGLASRLLAGALQENPGGLVLFSTSRPDRIASILRAARYTPADVEPVLQLLEMCRAGAAARSDL